eukprot:571387-Amphidinium_carterae.2
MARAVSQCALQGAAVLRLPGRNRQTFAICCGCMAGITAAIVPARHKASACSDSGGMGLVEVLPWRQALTSVLNDALMM